MPLVNNGTKKIPLRLYNSELGFLFIFLSITKPQSIMEILDLGIKLHKF